MLAIFASGVIDLFCVDALLRLKRGINAFRRNDRLPLVLKDEGRILPVKNEHIDLFAEHTIGVHNMPLRRAVTLRQVCLEHVQPYAFAGISLRAWMRERFPRGRESSAEYHREARRAVRKETMYSWLCSRRIFLERRSRRMALNDFFRQVKSDGL